jgi:anti-sigma regulatory factor (Ser/Thr protein kinase)
VKYEAQFPAIRTSVPSARRFVSDTILGIPGEICDTLALIASELASNCVRHAGSAFEIRIEQLPDRIHIEVEDDGGGDPVVQSPHPSDTSGRGLQIVSALADDWGVIPKPDAVGKTVWVTIALRTADEGGPLAGEAEERTPQPTDKSTGRASGASGSHANLRPLGRDLDAVQVVPSLGTRVARPGSRTRPSRRRSPLRNHRERRQGSQPRPSASSASASQASSASSSSAWLAANSRPMRAIST